MKTALITGAAGSLGTAVAKRFTSNGYKVIGIVNKISTSSDFETVQADLTDEAQTEKAVTDILEKYSQIDVLIATAGGFAMGDIKDTKSSDIMAQYKINFETAYHIARPVFNHMKSRGSGRIFLTGSRAGIDTVAGAKSMLAYSLSKSLLARLAEVLNEEAKDLDVVTSLIVPSIIDTPPNRKAMPGADTSKWVTPEAIAEVIYFYGSEAAISLREPIIKVYGKS